MPPRPFEHWALQGLTSLKAVIKSKTRKALNLP